MKKLTKLIILCLIFLLPMSFLTGCWNSKELDQLSIVQAIGIDRTNNEQISLTSQILIPSAISSPGSSSGGGGTGRGSTGAQGVLILKSTGETVYDALKNATYEADRRIYLPFNKIIVIGEDTAKGGIAPLLDFFLRDPEPRGNTYILIARGNAEDIIRTTHRQESVPAKALENMITGTLNTSKAVEVNLHEVSIALADHTSDLFLTGIEMIKQEDQGQEIKKPKLSDTAILDYDKLIGWFNGQETRGMLWIRGEVKEGIIVVQSPGPDKGKVSLKIINASSQVKPEMKDGKLMITVKVKENGTIGEQMSPAANIDTPEYFKELEKRQERVIKEEIMAALEKGQKEWGVDIFEFGEEVHRKFPREWKELKKNWGEEIKNIEVKVEVESNLRMFGKTTSPE